MAMLGLDIGSDTIKMVELSGGKGRLKLVNYGVAPTPPGAVANGDVADADQIADAIRNLVKTRKIGTSQVVTSVQGQQSVVVRIIKVHRVTPKELDENMRFEVERHVPFGSGSFIMDYVPIERDDEPADSPNMEVLFAAAVDTMIEDLFATLRSAKLKPTAIDVQPLALSHSLVEGQDLQGGRAETVAVVNIGAINTDLGVIKDGKLHFPRTIPIGGRSITQRLSEGLGVSEQQAERLKRQYGSLRALPPELAARLAQRQQPEPEAVEAPSAPAIDFGADLFDLDPGDSSDMGFAGLQGGLSFGGGDDNGPPEVVFDDSSPGVAGATSPPAASFDDSPFDFDALATGREAAPPVATDDRADATAFEFDFGGDEPSPPTPTGASSAAAPPPAVATDDLADSTTFDFDLDDSHEQGGPAARQPLSLEPDDGDQGARAMVEPGSEEPAEDNFVFDFDSAETAATSPSSVSASGTVGSALGSAEEPDAESSFDFTFDDAPTTSGARQSSLGSTPPAAAAPKDGGAMGSDLGFMATDPGSSATGGNLDLAFGDFVDSGAQGDQMLAPDDEERLRVREVMEPVIRDLAQEVARSLEYYRSQYEGAVVDRVVLAGGTARIEGLAEFFENELSIAVEEGRPLQGIAVSGKLAPEELGNDEPLLAVAVGLAMRGLM